MLVLKRGEKQSTREKPLGERTRTNNKLLLVAVLCRKTRLDFQISPVKFQNICQLSTNLSITFLTNSFILLKRTWPMLSVRSMSIVRSNLSQGKRAGGTALESAKKGNNVLKGLRQGEHYVLG